MITLGYQNRSQAKLFTSDHILLCPQISHNIIERHLSEDLSILGQMCFTDGLAEIYDPINDEYREIMVTAGTMIVDPDTFAKRNLGTLAKEVIAGKWGNGEERKQKLTAAGYDYNTVQKRVNEMLS